MSVSAFNPQSRSQAYFQQRPEIINKAIGYVSGLGYREHFGTDAAAELEAYRAFFARNAELIESAWQDYYVDYLMGRRASTFPRWHVVEARLRDLRMHENLPDYLHVRGHNAYKTNVGWDRLDHICAFVWRVQMVRFDREEAGASAWTQSQAWGAAYILVDMLHWLQVEQQNVWLKSGEVTQPYIDDALAHDADAMAPIVKPEASGLLRLLKQYIE